MALDINELDIFIGNKVRNLRKKKNIGLKYLSSKLSISIQQLHKYETGINKISASSLYKIIQILGIPVENFFQDFDETKHIVSDNENFNVLLIDDDIRDECIIRQAISELPAKITLYAINGYQVSEFLNNFNQGILKDNVKPDLLLLELHLFKFNGLNILKTLRKHKSFNSVPAIIITNATTSDEISLSYSLQAGGVIVKSCSFEGFKQQIQDALTYWTRLVKLPQKD